MEEQNVYKRKLTIDEQVQDLLDKGVQFELYPQEDAKKFLKYNNYFFKLKSYAKNYTINPKTNKYVNLDFAYLVELSKLDMYIRKIILDLSLDVEHFLKVRLMNDLCNNSEEDGYNIVSTFLRFNSKAEEDIRKKASGYSFCSDLAEKYVDETEKLALWNIVELLSFGDFVELYTIYYQTYKTYNYIPFLKSIKFLRNAAAHNNCILSSLKKPNGTKKFSKTNELTNALGKISELADLKREKMMKNPIIHDFVALILVYNDLLKVSTTKTVRNKKMEEIKNFFCAEEGRILKNKSYFEKNSYIKESYEFVSGVIKYIVKKNSNPKHTNYF